MRHSIFPHKPQPPYKLNIGGGFKKFDGFFNVDSDPLTSPDFLVDLEREELPLPESCVNEVKAHHILEHIGAGFYHLLKELYRVCEDGAIIDIQVPHHRSEMWYGDSSHVRFVTVEMMRQFSKKHNEWHVKQWGSSSGFGTKLDVDFEIVEFAFIPDERWRPRLATMSPQEVIEVSSSYNNVYRETHIKLQVIKPDASV